MERTFNVYRFKGITKYDWHGKGKFLPLTLKECLDDVYTYSNGTTKELFERHGFVFERTELTADQLREKIAEGLTVFLFQKIREYRK